MSNRHGYNNVLGLTDAFPDEAACASHLAALRWPDGITCPLCESTRHFTHLTRPGKYKCGDCLKQFSVRKGTVYEESRLPLRKWFLAAFLMTTSRKGISSLQLAREIGTTQKTAWFVLGRLRKAAEHASSAAGTLPGPVEADESYFGGRNINRHDRHKQPGRGMANKMAGAGVVSRTSGQAVARQIERADRATLIPFVEGVTDMGATVYTDEHGGYTGLSSLFNQLQHETVHHSAGEYVRGKAHTNGVESFWALLKRGYHGVFHDFSQKHLDRYLAEFSHRWNMLPLSSAQRVDAILKAGVGGRLTYEELTGEAEQGYTQP